MKTKIAIVILSCMILMSCTLSQQKINREHPILGIWRYTFPETGCAEVYNYQSDGKRKYSSGNEAGESSFEVSQNPSEKGYYSLKDTIEKNNGKADCTGGHVPVGDTVHIFIKFNSESKREFSLCFRESLGSCIGPFVKQ